MLLLLLAGTFTKPHNLHKSHHDTMIINKSVNITAVIREPTFYESGPSTGSIYKTSFEVVTANDAALTPGKPYLSDEGALEWMVKEREVQLYQLQAAPPSTQPWEKVELAALW